MVFVALVLRNNIFLIFFVLAGQHPNLGKFRVAFIHNKANTAKNLVIINENVLSAPNFAPGNTYVYKYETVIMGGLPEEGLARAGLKLASKVKISVAERNILLLQVNVKFHPATVSELDCAF